MNNRRLIYSLLLTGLLCSGIGIYSLVRRPPIEIQPLHAQEAQGSPNELPRNSDGTFRLNANLAGWHPIGTGTFSLEVTGGIDFGGGNMAGPNGSRIIADNTGLVAGVPFGTLVAKIGETGRPFQVGSLRRFDAGSETVYLAINDSYYDDNLGAYMINKR
jgi:hypothetical protein